MKDMALTPGEALWLLANMPKLPTETMMIADWLKIRQDVCEKLQWIVDIYEMEAAIAQCKQNSELP